MSVSSIGGSSDAYSYLQSLLQQHLASAGETGRSRGAMASLMDAFYPGATNNQSAGNVQPFGASQPDATGSSPTAIASGGAPVAPLSPDTMANLIALQGQQGGEHGLAARSDALFSEFDTDGDGQISKSELESAFGSGADLTKVDGLFNALDSNQDGSVSRDELKSAAEQSHAHHHHHAHGHAGGEAAGLMQMLQSASQGATSQTSSNSDGSTTTTISYADGSKVTMTTPPGSSRSSNGSGSPSSSNLLEHLIQLQAQWSAATPLAVPGGI